MADQRVPQLAAKIASSPSKMKNFKRRHVMHTKMKGLESWQKRRRKAQRDPHMAAAPRVRQRPLCMTTRTEGPRRSMPREPHGNGILESQEKRKKEKREPTTARMWLKLSYYIRTLFLKRANTRCPSSIDGQPRLMILQECLDKAQRLSPSAATARKVCEQLCKESSFM